MPFIRNDDTRGSKIQGFRTDDDVTIDDPRYQGTSYSEVKQAIFANPYQDRWGDRYQRPLPRHRVSLIDVLRLQFTDAAARTLDSVADLRWGRDGKGWRRLIHPNGVCLTGTWRIHPDNVGNSYSGYFRNGSEGLVIARLSSNSTATTRDRIKSFGIVGKIYPTMNEEDKTKYRPANFFTQDDFGGTTAQRMTDVEYRNAPDVTPFNRGPELPILLQTARVLGLVDQEPMIRQLYEIAELRRPDDPSEQATRTPRFMQLTASPGHLVIDEEDFRDEVMSHIFDRNDPSPVAVAKRELHFDIRVADAGMPQGNLLTGQRHDISGWRKIGVLSFNDAVISYNGDFVLHFHHPPWRTDLDDPSSVARQDGVVRRM